MLSRVQVLVAPQTVAHQALLSMDFSRQEYWSGLPFSPPRDLPNPGINAGTSPMFLALAGKFFTTSATWDAQVNDITIHPLIQVKTSRLSVPLPFPQFQASVTPPSALLDQLSKQFPYVQQLSLQITLPTTVVKEPTFLLNVYLLGCTRSQLQHVGSSIIFASFLIFIAACGIFQSQPAGSSSLTRDQTQAPCIGNRESQPLDHQEVPVFPSLHRNEHACSDASAVTDTVALWTVCSLPGSSVHGILQVRILQCVAVAFSRESSDPGIEPTSLTSPALQADSFTAEPPGKPRNGHIAPLFKNRCWLLVYHKTKSRYAGMANKIFHILAQTNFSSPTLCP